MKALNEGLRAAPKSLGFSMVELMVALTVGLLLIGGMVATLVSSSTTGKVRERSSEIQNNGRYALEVLKRDVQHAGFIGVTGDLLPEDDIALTGYEPANNCDKQFFGKVTLRVVGT